MAGREIYIAIVRSECKIVRDREFDLEKVLEKKLAESDKYKNVRYELAAWDKPNDWEKFTHILLGSGIDYASHPEKFLTWLDNLPEIVSRRVLNSPDIIRWNMDKKYLLDLKNAGIKLPPTLFLDKNTKMEPRAIINELKKEAKGEISAIVVKNRIDAGGFSSRKIKLEKVDVISEVEFKIIQEMQEATNSGLIIQDFLPRISSEGEWSVLYFDRKISHGAIKKPCENDFRVQGRFGGTTVVVDIDKVPQDVLELSKNVIDKVPQQEKLFYARVDILRNMEDEPCLMELEAFEPDLYYRNNHIIENFLTAICDPKYSNI